MPMPLLNLLAAWNRFRSMWRQLGCAKYSWKALKRKRDALVQGLAGEPGAISVRRDDDRRILYWFCAVPPRRGEDVRSASDLRGIHLGTRLQRLSPRIICTAYASAGSRRAPARTGFRHVRVHVGAAGEPSAPGLSASWAWVRTGCCSIALARDSDTGAFPDHGAVVPLVAGHAVRCIVGGRRSAHLYDWVPGVQSVRRGVHGAGCRVPGLACVFSSCGFAFF